MKPLLAAATAALFLSGAALAQTQTTPRTTIQGQPPGVDTGSQGYQGQGGPSTTTPTSGVPADTGTPATSSHRSAQHHGKRHAKTHHAARSHASSGTGTAVGTDATASGTATAPT